MLIALSVLAVSCVAVSAYFLRRPLQERGGLRKIFFGLALSSLGAVAIALGQVLTVGRVLSLVMLAGIAVLIWGVRLEKQRVGSQDSRP